MQYRWSTAPPPVGVPMMSPAKLSSRAVNPVVGLLGGYPCVGSKGLSKLARNPVTP